jgi:hypothetical protein
MLSPVPSAAELGEQFAQLQNLTKPEFIAQTKEVTSTFDLNALKTMASKMMAKECLEVFMVAEGVFLSPPLYVLDNLVTLCRWIQSSTIIPRALPHN